MSNQKNMFPYQLIRSKRKTISLQINENCEVVVRAPMRMPREEIDRMVERHTDWIERHMPAARERMEQARRVTPALMAELAERARRDIPPRVAHYASLMGVEPTGLRTTAARKLAHIRHHNHSPAFYRFIEQFMPDYRQREALLRRSPESYA